MDGALRERGSANAGGEARSPRRCGRGVLDRDEQEGSAGQGWEGGGCGTAVGKNGERDRGGQERDARQGWERAAPISDERRASDASGWPPNRGDGGPLPRL